PGLGRRRCRRDAFVKHGTGESGRPSLTISSESVPQGGRLSRPPVRSSAFRRCLRGRPPKGGTTNPGRTPSEQALRRKVGSMSASVLLKRLCRPRPAWLAVAALVSSLALVAVPAPRSEAQAPGPSQIGQWSGVTNWPFVAVHMQLLQTGKVTFYPYSDDLQQLDPA